MSEPSSSAAAAGVLFPELLTPPEPAPPVRSHGSRVLRMLARVLLWSLVAAGALRGLMPVPERPSPAVAAVPSNDRRGEAVAAAFLREYLTVGDDRTARTARLRRFAVAGVDLSGSVLVANGLSQYVDLVVAAGSIPVAGGIEVTVLAHVLQGRSGTYRDGGTLAFVVPMEVRREGVAVRARPRPTALPVAAGLSLPRPGAVPAALSRPARSMARRAVAAYVAADLTTLTRLGGGRPPSTRPLPPGWHAVRVGQVQETRSTGPLAAQVPVRVRPPTGTATYLVLIRVQMAAGPRGLTVRRIDGGLT